MDEKTRLQARVRALQPRTGNEKRGASSASKVRAEEENLTEVTCHHYDVTVARVPHQLFSMHGWRCALLGPPNVGTGADQEHA